MSAISLMASSNPGTGRIGSVVDAAAYAVARLVLDCTASVVPAGQSTLNPPILEVHVETSPVSTDGNTWRRIASFDQVRSVSQQTKTISNFDRYLRVAWESRVIVAAIDGVQQSPAFTWALTGDAV